MNTRRGYRTPLCLPPKASFLALCDHHVPNALPLMDVDVAERWLIGQNRYLVPLFHLFRCGQERVYPSVIT
jgi:hypothetical protein